MVLPKKDYVFVGLQLLLFVAYALPLHFYTFSLPKGVLWLSLIVLFVGIIIGIAAVLQLHTTLSPYPSPKVHGRLVQQGVFALVRHPIYFAIIACSLGWGVYQTSTYQLLVAITLIILFHFKSKYEEELLLKKYSEYIAYQQKVGRLFPKLFA